MTWQLATPRVSDVRERQRPPKTEAAVSHNHTFIRHTSLLPYCIVHKDQPWHPVGGGPTGSEQQEVGLLGYLSDRPSQPLTPHSHPAPAEFEVRK